MTGARIASLVPSATEIVAALGLRDNIVLRSHECDWPAAITRVPACTRPRIDTARHGGAIHADASRLLAAALGLYDLDTGLLREARPTHIVTQDRCDVCAVSLAEVEAAVEDALEAPARVVSLKPARLTDVWADIDRVGTAIGIDAAPLRERLRARVAALAERAAGAPPKRVAAIEWTDPPMAAGHWVPDLIVAAGGIDALGAPGRNAGIIECDEVRTADPDVIVLMPCGYGLARTEAEGRALLADPAWQALRAVRAGEVYATDGSAFFNRPGPRLVESLEILAEILHPARFDFGHRGTGWRRLREASRRRA